MNILNFKDAENYLKNKQVYFKKEICNIDFRTIAESEKVHNIGHVEIIRISDENIMLEITINKKTSILTETKTDLEFFAWIKTNFIPVSELIKSYNHVQIL